jgi:transcriptional regulator with XRE-family HTH domain
MSVRKTAREVLFQAVKARRNLYGNQADLAEALGVTPETLSRWLTDKLPFNPTLDLVERMVGKLGIEPASIFEGVELPAPEPPKPPVDLAELQAMKERLAQISGEISEAIKPLPSGKKR